MPTVSVFLWVLRTIARCQTDHPRGLSADIRVPIRNPAAKVPPQPAPVLLYQFGGLIINLNRHFVSKILKVSRKPFRINKYNPNAPRAIGTAFVICYRQQVERLEAITHAAWLPPGA